MATNNKYRKTKNSAPKKSYPEKITEQLISYIEKGSLSWHKPWIPLPPPQNGLTHYKYGAYNNFLLTLEMRERDTVDPRFFTFLQLSSQGWSIRKGAKAVTVYQSFPAKARVEVEDKTEEEESKEDFQYDAGYRIQTSVPVYHASDICIYPPLLDADGKPVMAEKKVVDPFSGEQKTKLVPKLDFTQEPVPLTAWEPETFNHEQVYAKAEQIIAASGANFIEEKIDRAYFSPALDEIHVPLKEHFKRLEDYYGTALHELTHWTGHRERLNRDMTGHFGSESYAREELIAELSSVFLSVSSNVPINLEQNAAYLESWLKALKEDPKFLLNVISEANKAHDYLQGKVLQMEYIPVTERLKAACDLVNACSGFKECEKPRGLDNLPSRIISNFSKALKDQSIDSSKIGDFTCVLESIKAAAMTKGVKPDYEKLTGFREQYHLLLSRQKYSNINPEFIKKDIEKLEQYQQIKKLNSKKHDNCVYI